MSSVSYTPDDGGVTPAALEYLRTEEGKVLQGAIEGLANSKALSVSEIAGLRKRFSAEMVRAGLMLAGVQEKGRRKFSNLRFVWGTTEAVEQASSRAVAMHKAWRFARARPAAIFDLCCGIGGDALSLAEVAPVTAVDLSAVRGACLRLNAEEAGPRFGVEVVTADVMAVMERIGRGAFVHIDPARRVMGARGKKRITEYADAIPGPEVIEEIFSQMGPEGGGAIKLSPAADFEALPEGHLELISEHGVVVQAVLWRGVLAEDMRKRTATVIDEGQATFSLTAAPGAAAIGEMSEGPFTLYELDGAVTRAGLAAALAKELGLTPVTVDGGYCVSKGPAIRHPALTGFKIQTVTPFSERRVVGVLRQLPAVASGAVEVKARGHLPGVDTDHLQRAWSKAETGGRTVLVFSHRGDMLAAVGERMR